MKLVDESRIRELLRYADGADHLNPLLGPLHGNVALPGK
jgi:hypothetical protein